MPILKKILFFFLASLIFFSCRTARRTEQHTRQQVEKSQDSIVYEIREVTSIDTFWIRADTGRIVARIRDSLGQLYIERMQGYKQGSIVMPRITHQADTFIFECIVDSFAIYHTWKKTHIKESNIHKHQEKIQDERTVIIKKDTIYTVLWILAGIVILGVVLRIFAKFFT